MKRLALAFAGASLAAALPCASLAAAPVALGPRVTTSHLQGDAGTAVLQTASGAPVASLELWFRAPSTGFGKEPVVSLARLAAQAVAASKPIVGDSLGEAVSAVGGKLAITVYGDSVAVSALVPANAATAIAKAMTVAYFSPVLTADGLKAAARDVEADAVVAAYDPDVVVRNATFEQLFSAGPQRYPALGTVKEIAAISFADVQSFATRAFRVQNAVLSVAGTVDATLLASVSSGRPASADAAAEAPVASTPATAPAPVTKPFDAAACGFGWAGPPIADERAATTMDFIADYLFRSETGVVARAVAAKFPSASLSGQFVTLNDPGVMYLGFSGVRPDDVRPLVDAALAALRAPLDPARFEAARDAFEYHILADLQTPSQIADNFGWYAVEGNLAYAPGANDATGPYFEAANAMTPASVAEVAKRYLSGPPVVVTLSPEAKTKSAAGTGT